MSDLNRALASPLVLLVRAYQRLVSPLTPPSCRFYPSCSAYAVTALTRFGPFKGAWLAVCRLGRCHPWNPGGVDHVPQTWAQRHERPDYVAPAADAAPQHDHSKHN
jgi:putative membrane protein insertion efficiency factor